MLKQSECWEAVSNGKILVDTINGFQYWLAEDGRAHKNGDIHDSTESFYHSTAFKIKEKFSAKVNKEILVENIVSKNNYRLVLEDDHSTPATELSRTTNVTFVDHGRMGANFDNFPCEIDQCMSGNTYINLSFVNLNGDVVYTVVHSKYISFKDPDRAFQEKVSFRFPDDKLKEYIGAVVWEIDRWGGESKVKHLMILSKPRTLGEISEMREKSFLKKKNDQIDRTMRYIREMQKKDN